MHRLARTMAARHPSAVRQDLEDAISALRAEGVPLAANVPIASVPAAAHSFARAIEQCITSMSSRPTALDLAHSLGVGERQALRRARDHFRQFYASIDNWRDYVRAMRIGLGAFFMSQPAARTEDVSRLVGFNSPSSFCHALADAGLASPTELQRKLQAS